MRDFTDYAQFDQIWDRFLPETPYGRAAKEAMTVRTESVDLVRIWDETEVVLALLKRLDTDAVRLSQLQQHLKRLPRTCEEARPCYDEVELFQFKKFLHNYKSLGELLDPETRSAFGLAYASADLERLLDQGRQSAESFYVADAYAADLAQIRLEIRETDAILQTLQTRRSAAIQTRWGFEFGTKTFLLVPRETLGRPEAAARSTSSSCSGQEDIRTSSWSDPLSPDDPR